MRVINEEINCLVEVFGHGLWGLHLNDSGAIASRCPTKMTSDDSDASLSPSKTEGKRDRVGFTERMHGRLFRGSQGIFPMAHQDVHIGLGWLRTRHDGDGTGDVPGTRRGEVLERGRGATGPPR